MADAKDDSATIDIEPKDSTQTLGYIPNSPSLDKFDVYDSEWPLKHEVIELKERDERTGFKPRELGVTWYNLSVDVVSAESAVNENVISQFNIPKKIMESRHKPPLRRILDRSHGCVKPGEMLLVLGRPGSGCTTLLNLLANRRRGYVSTEGDVWYGSMTSKEAAVDRGQIVMNTEEELFFPTMTVDQTLDFATRLKLPFHRPDGLSKDDLRAQTKDFLLRSMGIEHTANTMVGNEFVRGVSGGERKRVSIIEALATKGSVYCWDNSTRGLDASTALGYTKAIRAMTDILGLSSVITLYQAGNGIYDLFDKVLVLDNGKEIYYGPMKEARPFMENLGFLCHDGSNVADFLSGVTVPTERLIRPGFENRFPRTANALQEEYEKSSIKSQMEAEYEYPTLDSTKERTQMFRESVAFEKNPGLPKSSPLTVSFFEQVKAAIVRQYQIIWGNKSTFIIKQVSTIIQALICGSLFYNASPASDGLFIKSGALFFSILFHSLMAMSEVTESFGGRPVLIKHKFFAYHHPAAFCVAQIAADIPVLLFQISTFSLIIYFMTGLTMDAGKFFTYWIVVFATTMATTALFRAVGAICSTFDGASKISGFLINCTVMYTGYMIQRPQMHPWFGWIYWIDPLAYGFQSLLANEFHGKIIPCAGTNLVPSGPEYTDHSYQACTGVGGSKPFQTYVTGDDYLASLHYSYGNVWRNFGINWALWFAFVVITIVATSRWHPASDNGPSLLIPRENLKHVQKNISDEEFGSEKLNENTKPVAEDEKANINESLVSNTSVFTWKNLCYTVKTASGDRQLLDHVNGWVKPGMLGALMGSSGAGKTTLLDVLAQRKTEGTITGSVLVDGRPLPISFQRSAGYCEQLDVHEPYATVRESLEFSALLRQNPETPREEKLRYVDVIIDLLELHDIADTLVGKVGAGLSVEQRKRVTIGVELVSKPSILIFLDEPTSGLDGQSAFNTVRFLRKLADVGQAVLVTIHQPSAQLFAQFDTLLLLSRGGKTVYFGDIGDNGQTVKDYFARYNAPCPNNANPAEHMIDVVSGELSQGRDWNKVWLESPECAARNAELDAIIADAASKPPATVDDGREFATPLWDQMKIVSHRMNKSLFRNVNYVDNKMMMHVSSALFNGFSYWNRSSTTSPGGLSLRLFTCFNFIFVCPGVLAQLQPLFIERREIYEARERKSKMYSWIAFTTGLVLSEIPYLLICGLLYWACWYYTVGFPKDSNRSGATLFVMLMYEFFYTGLGQFVAAYAPNAVFATLVNPLVIGTLISFCGVLVPYSQIQAFWRYWIYWLNPFNYLMGSMLTFSTWGVPVKCSKEELAIFNPLPNTTCGSYLSGYMKNPFGKAANLLNPDATNDCMVCEYENGSDYLSSLNLNGYYYGWRDAAIVVIFVLSSYALVFVLMKLRTKVTKKAEN